MPPSKPKQVAAPEMISWEDYCLGMPRHMRGPGLPDAGMIAAADAAAQAFVRGKPRPKGLGICDLSDYAAALRVAHLPERVRLKAIAALTLDDPAAAVTALVQGAATFNGGKPPNRAAAARGRAAYLAALRRGEKKEAAIAAATEASGLRRTRIFELKKKDRWDADL